jgi:hypothetical protein
VLHHVLAEVLAHSVRVPSGVVEEVLDPSWSPLSDSLGHLPGVLAPDDFQQPAEVAVRSFSDLWP